MGKTGSAKLAAPGHIATRADQETPNIAPWRFDVNVSLASGHLKAIIEAQPDCAGGNLFVALAQNLGAFAQLAHAHPVTSEDVRLLLHRNLKIKIRVDGSNEFHTFNRIVLPMIKPAIAVQAIFAFVENWNNYFIPALLINSNAKKTIPILIAQLRSADYLKFDLGKVYMLVFIAIIPVMIVYIFLSKFIIKGVTMGGLKG